MTGFDHQCTVASWVKTVGGGGSSNFLFDIANFQ